jgi:aspartyl-tRNA synthetase
MAKEVIAELVDKINQKLIIQGWVDSVRDHGNLVFLDIRDRSSQVQAVVFKKELITEATALGTEDLVELSGTVQSRPEKLINKNIPTGSIEFAVDTIKLIAKCAPIPFEVNNDTENVSELIRFEYRYLDLRSARMKNNLMYRHKINHFFRNYLETEGFWEVETPSLTKGTPEGAREYIVPARNSAGKFFVLPQSPQQFKQLLMVAGVEKYYQIARCFRDEDQRGDRQPEFSQLDLEQSFVSQEDILNLIEKMTIGLVSELFPDKKLASNPFPRMTYEEVIKKYNSDKPDLRQNPEDPDELAFLWVVDFPMFEYSDTEKKLVASHHPFTRPLDEDHDLLDVSPEKARAAAYDLVLNGSEIGGGSLRIHEPELQRKIFKILEISEADTQARFGHMLKAFDFAAPPHGGFAFGLDRLISILLNQKSIREVIAFPKTGDANDPLTGAPDSVSDQTLKEVHIEIKKPRK